MDVQGSVSVALGSDLWLGADAYEPGGVFHTRATEFLTAVKWDVLAEIAPTHRDDIPCRFEDKFSIGHYNMVRRVKFDDGVSCVVRLRLPDMEMFEGREALKASKVMEIEIARMKFFGFVLLIFVMSWTHDDSHGFQVQNVYPSAQGVGLQHNR